LIEVGASVELLAGESLGDNAVLGVMIAELAQAQAAVVSRLGFGKPVLSD